jgi:hypothetical protein
VYTVRGVDRTSAILPLGGEMWKYTWIATCGSGRMCSKETCSVAFSGPAPDPVPQQFNLRFHLFFSFSVSNDTVSYL